MRGRATAAAAALACLCFALVPAAASGTSRPGRTVFMANARLSSAAASRPRTYLVSGDGGFRIARISWRRYGGAAAIGDAVAKVDSCRPSCVT